ncbi:phosphotransferase enzyme family protein [Paenibacillus sp. GCM10023248]|uniref:phosphotransferase enzyme family protein n=1 Tax=Bacillales TaxID=1385 RepID=UPI002378F0F0|nr:MULTISPECIES: phosphotransferase [Bacillales]MDD9270383.1 phosphotransferase [Paenibacillus sp. MAHUQ-63]MDR6884257.1 Ser/Thr protein kinase RdoA (MazF antagonist) [Bacillus sp. 3255]
MNAIMRVKDLELEEQLALLPSHWFPGRKWTMRLGAGGMNNTTRFVDVDGTTYVLRLYETHRDIDKIIFEHRILLALNKRKHQLPYRIPAPIELPDGGTVVQLAADREGKLAALFTFTDGTNPAWLDTDQVEQFGAAVGQLSSVLADIAVDLKPVYPPYYEIENIHPRCTPDAIREFCIHPTEIFSPQREELLYIFDRFSALYQSIPALRKLPHQLVHGDINGSNMLVDEKGQIASVLDFEFVTRDLRVMELAVCLSDFIDPTLPIEQLQLNCRAFYQGYRKFVQLKEAELAVLPLLIELRRLDVFIHFLGRYADGVDPQGVLIDIIQNAYEKTKWLQNHCHELVAAL